MERPSQWSCLETRSRAWKSYSIARVKKRGMSHAHFVYSAYFWGRDGSHEVDLMLERDGKTMLMLLSLQMQPKPTPSAEFADK